MAWPTPQDYNEALQTPRISFSDRELQTGSPELTPLGLPRPTSGNFASVYRIHCGSRDWAVRCFLRDVEDRPLRYEAISRFVLSDDLPYTVSFQYMQKGILLHGDWYPILKMEWVEGILLSGYVEQVHTEANTLSKLIANFTTMCERLRAAGIAHGDLQHGNIIMLGDDLRLVDYDGMFVPVLSHQQSIELGHPNYQHPKRSPSDFGVHLDNFSAWSIYTSLQCLALDPSLWSALSAGDDCLLLRRRDYLDPASSYAFPFLEHHTNEEIRKAAKWLRALLQLPLIDVPPLEKNMSESTRQRIDMEVSRLTELAEPTPSMQPPGILNAASRGMNNASRLDNGDDLQSDQTGFTGHWEGSSEEERLNWLGERVRGNITFWNAYLTASNGVLTGYVIDSQSGLRAEVHGRYRSEELTFSGDFGNGRKIEYVGWLAMDGGTMAGTWSKGADQGSWTATRVLVGTPLRIGRKWQR